MNNEHYHTDDKYHFWCSGCIKNMPIIKSDTILVGIEQLAQDLENLSHKSKFVKKEIDLGTGSKVVLRNIISKFDGNCNLCFRSTKQGDKIKWSKETGALCYPSCEATATVTPVEKAERKFDFSEDEGDKPK